jgi:lysophospholipase L1-like esterase
MRSLLGMTTRLLVFLAWTGPTWAEQPADRFKLLQDAHRVVFLGNSITAGGSYVAFVDTWIASLRLPHPPEVINMGLSSETVSGLSEEGHAGGRFPRPDLAERLTRVLATAKPDLVIACYGINCGIYLPFDEGRFEKYQQGLRNLKTVVEKRGAKLILITPPFYDGQRGKKPYYNNVLDRYSRWLLDRRADAWLVIDLHGAMTQEVALRREAQPEFTFQPDSVHPNEAGHWFMAQQIIRWFGDEKSAAAQTPQAMLQSRSLPPELLKLMQERMVLLRDAYVTAAGHKRPGVPPGLPLNQARAKAQSLSAKIQTVMNTKGK